MEIKSIEDNYLSKNIYEKNVFMKQNKIIKLRRDSVCSYE